MAVTINGSTGISGVDGSAGTPAIQGTDANTGISFPAADTVAINTGGVERSRVDSSGRLLVGTSSASANGTLFLQGTNAGATLGGTIRMAAGTTTPANGDELGIIAFSDSSHSQSAFMLAKRDGGTWTSGSSMPSRLEFSTTADGASFPTERMRITQDGYSKHSDNGTFSTVVTNTHQFYQSTSQWSTLFVNANASPYGAYIRYTGASPNGTGNEFLVCYDSGPTLRAAIRSNGGLANYSANNANLSDRNVKKDITPTAGTWNCIKEWEIVHYRYKDQPDDADLNLGVIAQQVAESCPEVITVFQEATEDEPEKLGVKEQQMYWMAIKALQEAQVRIEQLEAKVAALEAA